MQRAKEFEAGPCNISNILWNAYFYTWTHNVMQTISANVNYLLLIDNLDIKYIYDGYLLLWRWERVYFILRWRVIFHYAYVLWPWN